MQIAKIPRGVPFFQAAVCVCFIGKRSDVLLLKKHDDHPIYPGLWGFPAGRKKTGEKCLLVTACREIEEETGNKVRLDKLCQFEMHAYEHHRPNGKKLFFIARSFYLNEYVLPGFRLDDKEHRAAMILPAKEILALNPKYFVPDAHQGFVKLYELLRQLGKL